VRIHLSHIPDDWMAEWLGEKETVVVNPDGSNSLHRIQVILAQHGDGEYYEETNLGEAALYNHEPMWVMAGGLTMVGKVRDLAEKNRGYATLAEQRGMEVPDIPKLFMEYADELWQKAKRQSVFGRFISHQRS